MEISSLIEIFVVLMPIMYLGLVVLYALAFFGGSPGAEQRKSLVLVVAIIIHLA